MYNILLKLIEGRKIMGNVLQFNSKTDKINVGEENVEVGLLEYAPEIEVYLDDEGIPDIRFANDPEQLELFPEDK
jgi:hypothetical protein